MCLDDKGYGVGLKTQDYSLKSTLGHTVQEHKGIHSLQTDVDELAGTLPRKKQHTILFDTDKGKRHPYI